jgi:hypothetical protein
LACVQLGDFHGFPQLGTHWGKNQILGWDLDPVLASLTLW